MREEKENEGGIRENRKCDGGMRDKIFQLERDLLNLIAAMRDSV